MRLPGSIGRAISGRFGFSVVVLTVLALGLARVNAMAAAAPQRSAAVPFKHVVVIYEENHSFDNILGAICQTRTSPCDGATTGRVSDGSTIPLAPAPDYVPSVRHTVQAQSAAIDGGKMDAFDKIPGCQDTTGYACYTSYRPSAEPNIATLADQFAVSDRTFALRDQPSWASHLNIVAATNDGFQGNNPTTSPYTQGGGVGWGCDSLLDSEWSATGTAPWTWVPSCVPSATGLGPYRASPVPYVPTIMDRLTAAGDSWHIYGANGRLTAPADKGYIWTVCPSFGQCLDTSEVQSFVPANQVLTDASAGNLPDFSLVTPTYANSDHNGDSHLAADNWIGSVVSAIENGPEWDSTVVFITWDDCGCFYDHVNPWRYHAGLGIRMPMIVVSPYTKAGYTDSTPTAYLAVLKITEEIFGLKPLAGVDKNSYDYRNMFDFSMPPRPPVPLVHTPIPAGTKRMIAAHPNARGQNDVT